MSEYTCCRCGQPKTRDEMVTNRRNREKRAGYCRACDNAAKRARYKPKQRERSKQLIRKLPPYETLKRHFVDEGLSVSDIAEKYDVTRTSVSRTMKRRALALGDEWPLRSRLTRSEKAAQTMARSTVMPGAIMELVWEYLQPEAERLDALRTSPKAKSGFTLALEAFAAEHGFSAHFLKEVKRGRYKSMRHDYAVRLLTAIGEPPHPSLLQKRDIKYRGPGRKVAA